MAYRILHVDDDPDIRAIVELSLNLDPSLAVTSCANGGEALAASAEMTPDLILCDVMMPGMYGRAVLAQVRENARTAKTPFVFMTARAQTVELDELKSLGAAAVIAKPFDPMKLAGFVRNHLEPKPFSGAGDIFADRLLKDAATLGTCRERLLKDPFLSGAPLSEDLQLCAHQLGGVAGIFGYHDVSVAASTLEREVVSQRESPVNRGNVESALLALLERIKGASGEAESQRSSQENFMLSENDASENRS